jgi:hypothetical protein
VTDDGTSKGEGDVTLGELRSLRTRLAEDGTDLDTLAKLLPRIEGYTALVGGLARLRHAVDFLNGKD